MAIDLAVLKAECQNNPNGYSFTVDGVTQTLAQWFAGGFDQVCADLLNVVDPAFNVYRTAIPVAEVFDAVTWANFTPSDAVPTADALSNALFQSRQIACQTKQMNVQTMLMGQTTVNGSKPNIRAGLQDALTNLPSGANGALRSAGWVTVRDTVLTRPATRAEKLYADKTNGNGGTKTTAAVLTFEGTLSAGDIQGARNLP